MKDEVLFVLQSSADILVCVPWSCLHSVFLRVLASPREMDVGIGRDLFPKGKMPALRSLSPFSFSITHF